MVVTTLLILLHAQLHCRGWGWGVAVMMSLISLHCSGWVGSVLLHSCHPGICTCTVPSLGVFTSDSKLLACNPHHVQNSTSTELSVPLLLSHFPSLPHVQDSTPTELSEVPCYCPAISLHSSMSRTVYTQSQSCQVFSAWSRSEQSFTTQLNALPSVRDSSFCLPSAAPPSPFRFQHTHSSFSLK